MRPGAITTTTSRPRRGAVKPPSQELAQVLKPYFEHCIDKFGAERCMFESNFPVDRFGATYTALWNAFKRITRDYSAAEKTALYSGTAKRVYRLSVG